MKPFKNALLLLLAAGFIQASRSSPEPTVFVASTPCDMIPRAMLSIPANADCEFIKWRLALQRDPRNQAPVGYTLNYTYGMTQPNTTGFRNAGTSLERAGQWAMVNEPNKRTILRLNADTPENIISFVKLDDSLLHLLDKEGKMMIGHGGWSYTLNRK